MDKQWSLKSVHNAHGYQNIEKTDVHNNFDNWIKKIYGEKKIKIVDIGGGNGRVCLSIDKNIDNYWCLDLNSDNIEIGSEFFTNDDRINFLLFDIDEQSLDIECDVVYIDSVLTMIEDPFGALLKFSKVSDYTFVNRTTFTSSTEKRFTKWGGMTSDSTLWTFDFRNMLNFCLENGFTIESFENHFIIKNR